MALDLLSSIFRIWFNFDNQLDLFHAAWVMHYSRSIEQIDLAGMKRPAIPCEIAISLSKSCVICEIVKTAISQIAKVAKISNFYFEVEFGQNVNRKTRPTLVFFSGVSFLVHFYQNKEFEFEKFWTSKIDSEIHTEKTELCCLRNREKMQPLLNSREVRNRKFP